LNDVKFSFNSYTMNRTSIAFGVEAVKDKEYFCECVNKIIATRENAKKRLAQLGFTFPDAKANFIFATHREKKAADIFAALKERGIFVRYFNSPRIDNYLRITIGTDEQMEKLYKALGEIL
ncbi:MAG: aminotransferase class I/II-fold pyridoxal phosphate-dependent enzyme, partial [Lachnospiraceae bacterium]